MANGFTNHHSDDQVPGSFGSPTKPQTRGKRGQPRGAARGQPGCTWGQSLGESGAAGKGVNPPNLRKNGAANPTKQTIIILRGGAQFGSVAPARPRPRACPPPSQPLEFYFGALCKLWACNKKPSSSATTPWPFGDARALRICSSPHKENQRNKNLRFNFR